MKSLRLLRWSGSVLSPRTRPCCRVQQISSTRRFQSTALAFSPEPLDDTPPPSKSHYTELDLRQFPSPPPSRAASSPRLSALHARLSLSPRLPVETLARCLVHPTADPNLDFNNRSMQLLGCELLGFYTSEEILCRYPRLPLTVVFAAAWAYCGPKTLAAVTREWGVEAAAEPGGEVDPGLLQCKRVTSGNADIGNTGQRWEDEDGPGGKVDFKDWKSSRENEWKQGLSSRSVYDEYFGEETGRKSSSGLAAEGDTGTARTTLEEASSDFVQAVMGAVYLHGGRRAAKAFFQAHILSRHLDFSKLFEFRQPTRDLSRLCAREGFVSPVARILSETGRNSRHPVFVVGVFSGKDKLGEGQGGSLDEARIKAAISALKGWYLYSPLDVRVPSEMEGEGPKKPWVPVLVDGGEVVV